MCVCVCVCVCVQLSDQDQLTQEQLQQPMMQKPMAKELMANALPVSEGMLREHRSVQAEVRAPTHTTHSSPCHTATLHHTTCCKLRARHNAQMAP